MRKEIESCQARRLVSQGVNLRHNSVKNPLPGFDDYSTKFEFSEYPVETSVNEKPSQGLSPEIHLHF